MTFPEYPKIETLYQRDTDGTKKLMLGTFRDETVEYIAGLEWQATEKIDGTNVRMCWDGHKVELRGRTDNASMPVTLYNRLAELFMSDEAEQLFEQNWGDMPVMLCGEGYGMKIQKSGGRYIPDGVDFALFDVYMPTRRLWLTQDDMRDVARAFGVKTAPVVMRGTLYAMVEYVKLANPFSLLAIDNTLPMEGLVARPIYELYDRRGRRLIVKLKAKDFAEAAGGCDGV